jgi:DNA-directed RNA polymerase subunit A'
MNLHVPQSEEAIAEADLLMKVSENIISPRFGGPIIGGRHDHVTGAYLLTRQGVEMTRSEALKLTRQIVKLPENKKKFTGKEIFSLLLPQDLNFDFESKMGRKVDPNDAKAKADAHVKIVNGKIISGVIDAEGLAGRLLNEIFIKYGPERARQYIDQSTQLSINSFMKFGFSVGIDEQDIPDSGKKELKDMLSTVEERVNELIALHEKGELKIIPGKSSKESLEDYIMMELGRSRSNAGKIAEHYAGDNSAVLMAKTGARGSLLNLTQMAGCVGQQAVRGERIRRGYHFRTLSHFQKGDVSSEAEGFVRSNFKRGLRPTEYFFHSMGGREGLVDTAIRTGRSGYMQRRLINAMQDLVVFPDGTVRGDGGGIVQFVYGEDGIDPMKKGFVKEWI